jgi:hypothetical protein
MLEGRPLDWDLQREVALIPDEDWEKGPEHIGAKSIARSGSSASAKRQGSGKSVSFPKIYLRSSTELTASSGFTPTVVGIRSSSPS